MIRLKGFLDHASMQVVSLLVDSPIIIGRFTLLRHRLQSLVSYFDQESTSDERLTLPYALGFFQPVFSRGKATAIALPLRIMTCEHVCTRAVRKKGDDSVSFFDLYASKSCRVRFI